MKKLFLILLCLILCIQTGCSRSEEKPVSEPPVTEAPVDEITDIDISKIKSISKQGRFVFTRENFPEMDGSTSTVPLGKAIASVLLGETMEDVSDLTYFNKTTRSYEMLMLGYADILIAAEPAESVWEYKREHEHDWDFETFATDGLVFIVNKDNPVDSLTLEQVQKIYSGKITNWSQVGGDDVEIVPFQRNEESGSQAAMLKHVMKNRPIMDAPKVNVIGTMANLMEAIASYDNTPAAIGYTMYYYANNMKMAEGLKILKIDGVKPDNNTIRTGEYPFINNYYAVTEAGLSENDPARIMYKWLLSEEGQRVVSYMGYVPIMNVNGNIGPSEKDKVYTDWTNLLKYEPPHEKYTYFEPRSEDGAFIPQKNYGSLLAYVGARDEEGNELEGLVTTDGRIVAEPKYNIKFLDDFIVLIDMSFMLDYSNKSEKELENVIDNNIRSRIISVTSEDGRWLQELGPCRTYCAHNGYFIAAKQDGTVIVIDQSGKIVVEYKAKTFDKLFGKEYAKKRKSGNVYLYFTKNDDTISLRYGDKIAYLNIPEKSASLSPPAGSKAYAKIYVYEESEFPGYVNAYAIKDYITGKTYFICEAEDRRKDVLDENKNILFPDVMTFDLKADLVSFERDDNWYNYSIRTGEQIFTDYSFVTVETDDATGELYYNCRIPDKKGSDLLDKNGNVLIKQFTYIYTLSNDFIRVSGLDDEENYSLEDGTQILQEYDSVSLTMDRITGEKYYDCYSLETGYELLNDKEEVVFENCGSYLADGLISAYREDYFCYYSIETGELIFSYPVRNLTESRSTYIQ